MLLVLRHRTVKLRRSALQLYNSQKHTCSIHFAAVVFWTCTQERDLATGVIKRF